MSGLLYSIVSFLLSPSEWQTLLCFISSAVFVLLVIRPVHLSCDFGDSATICAVLVYWILSLPMWITGANQKPALCIEKTQAETKKQEILINTQHSSKKKKKDRRRRKSTDKDNKDHTKMDSYQSSRRTMFYSTLRLYEQVRERYCLKDADFYDEFGRYVLTPEQLSKNGFPLECPENPGHIILRCRKFSQDPTSRTCSRCYESFNIRKDVYSSDTSCYYHPARCESGHFECCNTRYGSKGCTSALYHVSSELTLDNVVFKRIEGKRQVREDQSYKVYALDCEMIFTTIGMEVAKIGLVDLEGKTIYQTFVLPEHPVLDYNTQFSGITANDLKGVNITLADVQCFLLRTLNKDTILVGHALQNDLRVLRLIHEKVVDTQVVFHEGSYRKKLKVLAHQYLNINIQNNKAGHDSIEDARACMELMLFKIRCDLEKCPPVQKKPSFPLNCMEEGNPYLKRSISAPRVSNDLLPLNVIFNPNCYFIPKKHADVLKPVPISPSLKEIWNTLRKEFCVKCGWKEYLNYYSLCRTCQKNIL